MELCLVIFDNIKQYGKTSLGWAVPSSAHAVVRCLEGVWKVSGRCLEGVADVWKVSARYLGCVLETFKVLVFDWRWRADLCSWIDPPKEIWKNDNSVKEAQTFCQSFLDGLHNWKAFHYWKFQRRPASRNTVQQRGSKSHNHPPPFHYGLVLFP